VTAGYIVTDIERLRSPMERICRFLCSAIGIAEASNVVPLTDVA